MDRIVKIIDPLPPESRSRIVAWLVTTYGAVSTPPKPPQQDPPTVQPQTAPAIVPADRGDFRDRRAKLPRM